MQSQNPEQGQHPATHTQNQRTKILGILNITRDSFSDGNLFWRTSRAIRHAQSLMKNGADILDIGAASSHPDAALVSPQTEIARLRRILKPLCQMTPQMQISIDSRNPEVQEFALQQKAQFLNDIDGFPNSPLYPKLAQNTAKLIVMFRRANPEKRELPLKIFSEMLQFLENRCSRLMQAGIVAGRLIVDPGMGLFLSPEAEVSLYFLRHLKEIKGKLGFPTLISVSRKSFLGEISGLAVRERGLPTLLAELIASDQGVDYIRTHDPKMFCQGKKIWELLRGKQAFN